MTRQKHRLNHDDAFKSIMGKSISDNSEELTEIESQKQITTTKQKTQEGKENLVQTAFYITEKHRKAMKIKTALGNKPEDKDLSSIVRAALDVYLEDILKNY